MKTLLRIPRPRASVPIIRAWAMPSPDTFSIAPIASLLDHWLHDCEVIVDPFARNSNRGTITNDLSPNTTPSIIFREKTSRRGWSAMAWWLTRFYLIPLILRAKSPKCTRVLVLTLVLPKPRRPASAQRARMMPQSF